MATIKEIAASLGVSTATVSNVIHGHLHKMSPETARRVQKKLEALQYAPNMSARMLAKGDTDIIGLIVNYPRYEEMRVLQDPFVSELVASVERAIRRRNLYMMIYSAQTAQDINEIARTWNTLGLVVCGLSRGESTALKQVAQCPVVFVDGDFEVGEDYNNIGLEDRKGARTLAHYLLQNGHRHIAFVSDQERPVGADAERLLGMRDVLKEAGVPWGKESGFFTLPTARSARERALRRLTRHIGNPVTAYMFSSDLYAAEAVNYFQDHGIRVPEDISVTGYDDNVLAQTVRPRLTTIHQDVSQKGESAVRMLTELMDEPDRPPSSIILPVTFVPGASVARHPGAAMPADGEG